MEPEAVGGVLDSLLGSLKPDVTKINKALLKEGVGKCLDSIKPATTWPMNFDDVLYDQLKTVVGTYIDNLGVQDTAPLTVGAAEEYTAADVDVYLGTFSGVNDEVRQKLRKKPRLLKLVKEEFTAQEQAKLVGNPFLIGLLSIFGPMIIEFIKNWLSRG